MNGSCNCGAVRVSAPHAPESVTECGCSICRRYGALWAYYPRDDVALSGETDVYAWGPKRLTFHRCRGCGCVMAWFAVNERYPECGVNARMLDDIDLGATPRVVEEDASI